MSYHDDRRYGGAHGRSRGYAADYYDDHPEGRQYNSQRDYGSRRTRRPRHEFQRRASSIDGDPSYHLQDRSQRSSYGPYEVFEWVSRSPSRSSRSSRDRHRLRSTSEPSRADDDEARDPSSDEDPGENDSDRDKDKGPSGFLREKGGRMLMHAALPLVAAGAAEALRARKEPGKWKGEKGKHVLTAAVSNGLINKDPSIPRHHHIMDTTLRGLKDGAPSREERAALQRRFGRVGGSRTSSNLKKAAVVGAVAFVGKELYDRYGRSQSPQSPARDDDGDHATSKKLSQSISEDRYLEMKSANHKNNDQRSAQSEDENDHSHHRRSDSIRNHGSRNRDYSSNGDSDRDMESDHHKIDYRRQQGYRDLTQPRSSNRYPGNHQRRGRAWSNSKYESDLGYSSDEQEKERKMKRDMMITSGLATAASVHAAHRVYGSFHKRKQRTARLEGGEITADEARKERIRANTVDAASLGLAALGITSAYAKWKEANEPRAETQSFEY